MIGPADHACGLYSGSRARDAMLVPYLSAGLKAGDKCVCIVEPPARAALLAGVGRAGGVDVDRCLETGQLELFTLADSYLRTGTISVDDMLDFWTDGLDVALNADGYGAARGVGDASALAGVMDGHCDDFALYEAELNRLVAVSPQAFLCLYDIRHFDGDGVLELLQTHPKVLVNGIEVDNPHYMGPDHFVAARRRRAWEALSDGEQRVAELAGQGLDTGEIAVRLRLSRLVVDLDLHGVFRSLDLSSLDQLVRFLEGRRPGR